MKRKSFALILVIMVMVMLGILGLATLSRSVSEARLAEKSLESSQAFWLAEAGVSRAIKELRSSYTTTGTALWSTAFGQGGYDVDVTDVAVGSETRKSVVAHGFIPFTNPRVERSVTVVLKKDIPPNFFDYTLYSAGDVDIQGTAFSVVNSEPDPSDKAIIYADDESIEHPANVVGDIDPDSTISPLVRLDFEDLLSKSQTQQNVYVYTGQGKSRKLVNYYTNSESFPSSFWFTPPTDEDDPTTGMPNVVYIMGDLTIKSNMDVVGGFFVVAGDVITDPAITQDADVTGSGTLEGAIYTRGECKLNGGGSSALNVNGGIWAGEKITVTGTVAATYNSDYMTAIESITQASVQTLSWKEAESAYEIVP